MLETSVDNQLETSVDHMVSIITMSHTKLLHWATVQSLTVDQIIKQKRIPPDLEVSLSKFYDHYTYHLACDERKSSSPCFRCCKKMQLSHLGFCT